MPRATFALLFLVMAAHITAPYHASSPSHQVLGPQTFTFAPELLTMGPDGYLERQALTGPRR